MRRHLAALAISSLAALPVLAQEPFNAAQKEALDARIRSFLIENPEVILEVFEVLEKRREVAEVEADAEKVARLGPDILAGAPNPVLGNPAGDVTVVKFSDYRCGFCKTAAPIVADLIAGDPGVRVVIREFPILGEDSVLAARVALAAAMQPGDVFERVHDALMAHRGPMTEDVLVGLAGEAGADTAALSREIQNPEIVETIRGTYALARELGIEGTPSFIIGGRVVRGMMQIDQMRGLVAEARAKKG
jgi:protein-disulfide isomerase